MDNTKWTELLQQAMAQPGLILKAYSAFHGVFDGKSNRRDDAMRHQRH